MLRLTKTINKKSNTLDLLSRAPKIRSDTLQATFTGKEKDDKTSFDLVMEHTKRKKSDFTWYQQGRVNMKSTTMKPRIGYDGRSRSNWYQKNPKWVEAESHKLDPEDNKKQYLPLTLFDLQRAIDLGRIDPTRPIDLNQIQNAHIDGCRLAMRGPLSRRQYGVILVNQGSDSFKTPNLHIEVQLADDEAIAAVEAAGSSIECAFYDMQSKMALIDPVGYFLKGIPISKRQLPPQMGDLFMYYNDPKKRGYLCSLYEINQERLRTAESYGFDRCQETENSEKVSEILTYPRKHPRQIFFGLQPGMMVNLADQDIYMSKDEEIMEYNLDQEYYEAGEEKIDFYKPRYVKKRR